MDARKSFSRFDLLVGVPGGVSSLRSAILRLAVEGRLTRQDPGDATFGAFPAGAPSSAVGQPLELLSIPDSWVWCRLADVASISIGRTPSTGEPAFWAGSLGGVPWVSIADIQPASVLVATKKHVSQRAAREVFRVPPTPEGTLLMSFKLSIGKTCLLGVKAYHNEAIASLVPVHSITRDYLLRTLSVLVDRGKFANAIKGRTLNKASLSALPVPMPPLAEQGRIVEKVDELMGLCDELAERQARRHTLRRKAHAATLDALTSADTPDALAKAWARLKTHWNDLLSHSDAIPPLRQAILQLAVRGRLVPREVRATACCVDGCEPILRAEVEKRAGSRRGGTRPVEQWELPVVPEGWRVLPLERLVRDGPTNGYSPKGVNRETALKVLTLSATTRGALDLSKFKFSEEELPPDSSFWLEPGDVLIQRANTLEYVGVAAIYDGPRQQYIFPDLMMRIRPSSRIDRKYLHLALSAPPARAFLRRRATGTSSTMPKINQASLRVLPLPIPPLEEQHRIVAKVEELMKLCDELEARAREQEVLASRYAEAAVAAVSAGA